jgi:hypothetical protein
MRADPWSFEANIARGYLPTGEPLEALYGAGPWTLQPEPQPQVVQCHKCGGRAYDLGDVIDCENCGVVKEEVKTDVRNS